MYEVSRTILFVRYGRACLSPCVCDADIL